jgi:hypothetical protein
MRVSPPEPVGDTVLYYTYVPFIVQTPLLTYSGNNSDVPATDTSIF